MSSDVSAGSGLRSRMKLHLGAFDCALDGWENTDVTPHMWIGRIPFAASFLHKIGKMPYERFAQHKEGRFRRLKYLNLTQPMPYADNSVEAVFSSHVFEHLFFDEVDRLVAEIQRILVPGGICRVIVPDLEKIVATFDPAQPGPFLEAIYEVAKRSEVKNSHHTGFTKASLVSLFRAKGFSSAYTTGYRQGSCPDIEKLDNRPDSIFFEAVK